MSYFIEEYISTSYANKGKTLLDNFWKALVDNGILSQSDIDNESIYMKTIMKDLVDDGIISITDIQDESIYLRNALKTKFGKVVEGYI